MGLVLITVKVPENYIYGLDELVRAKKFVSRSEAIRVAIRELLEKELWSNKPKEPKRVRLDSNEVKAKKYTIEAILLEKMNEVLELAEQFGLTDGLTDIVEKITKERRVQ